MEKNRKLIVLLVAIFAWSVGITNLTYAETTSNIQHAIQIQHPDHKVGKGGHVVGGLTQTLYPQVIPSNALQSKSVGGSLGSSGVTTVDSQDLSTTDATIIGTTSLPTSYQSSPTPVLNQKDLDVCWAFAGTDAITQGAQKQLNGTYPPAVSGDGYLLPAYYDYLSASNAFISPTINPLSIMLSSLSQRSLGDGNTLDYVPVMSLLGYNPALWTSSSQQPTYPLAGPDADYAVSSSDVQEKPIAQSTFNSYKKSNLHVDNTYEIAGFPMSSITGETNAQIQARAAQIKQLIYQYGAVQFGVYAEATLDYDLHYNTNYYNSSTNATYVPRTKASSYNVQGYLEQDHELEIVGYDDNYPASSFTTNPGMNGAFIVKNSWGTGVENKGYFYISYADLFVLGSKFIADGISTFSSNQTIYSATNTSPDASDAYFLFGKGGVPVSNNNLFTNTYTSQNEPSNTLEQLTAVSAYVDQAGVKVNILYKTGGVSSTTAVSSFKNLGSYTFTDAGYQTIPISPVNLPNHASYTIALQVTNMTSFSSLNVFAQNLNSASSGQYPILTTQNSWLELNNQWENISSSEGANFYLDADTTLAGANTVSFNSNGGTAVTAQKVLAGKTVTKPANPTRSGYTFVGWYSDSQLTQVYNFATTVTKSITLYAKWKVAPLPVTTPIYRLYNKNTGEHFYTESLAEKNADVKAGWNYEGIGWTAPTSGKPIYRVFNPHAKGGDHYYTMSQAEATSLVKLGWKWDNNGKPVFYSGGTKKVYVAYNPNAQSGAHNYTENIFEQDSLLKMGWIYGAVAWYGE